MIQRGFSLIELLVVIAIIGVLAAVGVVGFKEYTEATKTKVLIQNYMQIRKAIEFELVVAQNGLQSAVKEVNQNLDMVDEDRNVTTNPGEQRFIDRDTTCNNFLFSMQKHFESGANPNANLNEGEQLFKNPWNTNWYQITIDTASQPNHRQGQIQLVCYNQFSGFGNGAGCPIGSDRARIAVHAYLKHHGRWYDAENGTCFGTFQPSNADGDQQSDCLYRHFLGGQPAASNNNAKMACWGHTNNTDDLYGAFKIKDSTTDTIRAEAGGRCANNSGSNCD